MKGLHIIGDLYNCTPGDFLISAKALQALCLEACKTAELRVLGESHLAVHTWPERNQATLDVYVCNVTGDNSQKSETLYQLLIDAFAPGNVLSDHIWRGGNLPAVSAVAKAA